MFDRWPIRAQVTALVVLATLAASAAMMAISLRGPPPRPAPRAIADIVKALHGEPVARAGGYPLETVQLAQPPQPEGDEQRIPEAEAVLAPQLGAMPGAVRVIGEPGPRLSQATITGPFSVAWLRDNRPGDRRGWTVIRTGVDDHAIRWWWTTILAILGVLAAILLPAWLVARRIADPIVALGAAAGHASAGQPLAIAADAGPPEVRTTARALSDLHRRTLAYGEERLTMLGAIAHDLGTPLTRLAFRAEALPGPARQAAHDEIEAMRAMIEDALAMARPLDFATEEVDFAELCRAIVRDEEACGRDVTLVSPASLRLAGHPLLLRRMVQNLVDNAIRYGDEARLELQSRRGQAILRVRDSGPGFPPNDSVRLLAPFVRGEPSRNGDTGGTGLGLAIAAQIIERHRGTIELGDAPGGGALVTVCLPLS